MRDIIQVHNTEYDIPRDIHCLESVTVSRLVYKIADVSTNIFVHFIQSYLHILSWRTMRPK